MIKALIFDLDGVIVDSEPIHENVWKDFFGERNIKITKDDLINMKGARSADVIKHHMPDKTEAEIAELKSEKSTNYKIALKSHLTPVNGAVDFLREAKKRDLKIAIATSAVPEVAEYIINELDLGDSINILVTAQDVKRGKPDPEIYILAADKLGIDPQNCIVFEDAIVGVQAAQAAHMKVVALLTSHHAEDFEGIYLAANNFNEINLDDLLRVE